MAIENSIAGGILPNYALIDEYDLNIEGEYYLPIVQNLMALPGQEIKSIREVWSHPMALLQCREFFKDNPQLKLVEYEDTAAAAREIKNQNLTGIAAIASTAAASIYDLKILAPSIQTIKDNATRFFILNNSGRISNGNTDKASLRFLTEHKRGSLATVLNVMSDCRLNLTKIQSLPVIETPWVYSIFVDVTFTKYTHFEKAKKLLPLMTTDFKILGEYENRKQ